MNELKKRLEIESNSGELSAVQLMNLYDSTINELRLCANVDPDEAADIEAADKREEDLLEFESDLLDQAARIRLRTRDDILTLMDVWAKVSGIGEGDQPSPSDRIVMNIFRRLNNPQAMAKSDPSE